MRVVSGFVVTPYVGLIPNNYKFTKDINEVSEIFQVPLKHFLDYSNHITIEVERKSHTHHIHYMPYKDYNIWGATASMLKDLAIHLSSTPLNLIKANVSQAEGRLAKNSGVSYLSTLLLS